MPMNAIKSLSVKNFTAFREAMFEFSSGINVFIGENSTGKTQVLKLIYTLLKIAQKFTLDKQPDNDNSKPTFQDSHSSLSRFLNVFNLKTLEQLARSSVVQSSEFDSLPSIGLIFTNGGFVDVQLMENSSHSSVKNVKLSPPLVILPSHEILSIYPGFIATYLKREIPYDETYFDLAVLLNASLLRQANYVEVEHLCKPLEKVIADASKITLENERFYIELPEDGKLEANLVAEGYRKLATLVYLIRNGSLGPGSVLLWDEPEANLNPKLITAVSEFLIGLSKAGIQVFLATHDYLLANELSLHTEYHETPGIKFFSLFRQQGHDGVLVETGKTLATIANNPILDAFVAHHDKETELAYADLSQEEAMPA